VTLLPQRDLVYYGLFGLPLAFAGLPLYVHLPHYYNAVHGMELALIGGLLLLARLVDTVQDPLIGWAGDRWPQHRRRAMIISLPVMAVAFAALFHPPAFAKGHLAVWLVALLVVVYTAFSVLSIFYNALGVRLAGGDYHQNTRVTAAREGMVLVGVVLAAALPHAFVQRFGMSEGFMYVSGIFALLLAGFSFPLLARGEWFHQRDTGVPPAALAIGASLAACWQARDLRWLFGLFFVNALPVAFTSTLFLFFVEDRLDAESEAGWLLMLYFLTAAASIPVWSALSRHYGKRRPLMVALLLAVTSFIWAYGLQAGEVTSFAIICALSGIAVGGDMALLPSLLSDGLKERPQLHSFAFGLWNFLTKLTLALAAGIALPLLEVAGYRPGDAATSTQALAVTYALLPCALKLLSILLLFLIPLDARRPV